MSEDNLKTTRELTQLLSQIININDSPDKISNTLVTSRISSKVSNILIRLGYSISVQSPLLTVITWK